jgi:hypothetical protein
VNKGTIPRFYICLFFSFFVIPKPFFKQLRWTEEENLKGGSSYGYGLEMAISGLCMDGPF